MTLDGSAHESRAVLITTGSNRRQLTVPGAREFDNEGITYCASCDGPLFSGQDVVVIGGGNAGFESAAQLLAYTKSVTLLHHGPAFKADPVTVEKVLSHPNMTGIVGAKTKAINGEKFVSSIIYEKDGVDHELPVAGIFVEIGLVPSAEFVQVLWNWTITSASRSIHGHSRRASLASRAAGDCTNIKYHQNNISAGDAVRALEDIYVRL